MNLLSCRLIIRSAVSSQNESIALCFEFSDSYPSADDGELRKRQTFISNLELHILGKDTIILEVFETAVGGAVLYE